ncbi:Methyl-accepting chemotaxis protein NahY [Saliniradius amylolyticus]|uniref:Methyl-accepting chemotaxis protein NahY n=1 Tax=Saliniradius amylolyticus TaxID=2183582 RepID=A0A2S2E639_9ALTE|nr:methyl-accepting chemotaxis protein [Saliniradius amylolyticus]AWL13118.1 Methyl-accepting chemotaxis protein NahY [Saliniradius amylolyticus]
MSIIQQLTIKNAVAGAMVIALLSTTALSTLINISQFSSMFYDVTEQEHLPNLVGRAKAQILERLQQPIALSEAIANNTYVHRWVAQGEPDAQRGELIEFLNDFVRDYNAVAAFWVSMPTGNYYNQDGLFKQVSRTAERDQWFYDFMASGKRTELALDVSESTGDLIVFINARVTSRSNGDIGAAGLGFDVSDISKLVNQTQVGENGYMFLLDEQGTIAAHRNNALIGKSVKAVSQYRNIHSEILRSSGEFRVFQRDVGDIEQYIAVTELEQQGWKIVTLLPRSEVSGQVNGIIGLSTAITLVIAALFIGLAFVFARKVSASVQSVADSLKRMSGDGGDLTQRLDDSADNELGQLAAGFNAILAKLADLVSEIQSSEQVITQGMEKLEQGANQTVSDSSSQKAQTEQVATAMNQMGQTISEVSSVAHKTATDTEQAVSEVNQTNTTMLDVATTMHNLATAMQSTEQIMSELANQAESINSVVDVISGISEQTNLLALNAAIEAARAGEQGRGFAVVADEVRTLASRTQDSTAEIRDQIEQLQSSAIQSKQAIVQGAEQSADLSQQAQSCTDSLSAVKAKFEQINDGNHQVASATEQQASVVEHINESAQIIADTASSIYDNAETDLAEIKRLKEQALHMQAVVRQFKV